MTIETSELLNAISTLEPVSGRFELVAQHEGISAIIDYAHTPDALKKVLETINQIRTGNESLITVVGCGGNRDKAKRPIIGQIATLLSDKVIFTSDNPRDEHPDNIISEIEKGVDPIHFKKYSIIQDRRQAIKIACQMAQPNDIILVAGKGHENYQEINGNRYCKLKFYIDHYQMILVNRTNQSTVIKAAINSLLDKGVTDKQDIYTKVVDELGVPRPTVRRVARDLRNELLEKIQILQSDTKTSTATVEATAEQ